MVMEKTAAVKFIDKYTAAKIIAATLFYACSLFLILSLFAFFHIGGSIFCISGLASVTVVWGYAVSRLLTAEKVRNQKILAMSEADFSAFRANEGSNFRRPVIVYGICAFIIAGVLLLSAAVYWSPHMFFRKNSTGYSFQFYTLSLHPVHVLIIPDYWNGKPVTEIRSGIFYGMDSFRKVILPEEIEEIRTRTFEKCRGLETIELPEGVTEIRERAFCDCHELSQVTVPSTLQSIGSSAFRRCYKLQSIVLPYGCTVSEDAFKQSETKIVYNDGTSIEEDKVYRLKNEEGEEKAVVAAPEWSSDCDDQGDSLWFSSRDGWMVLYYYSESSEHAYEFMNYEREYLRGTELLRIEELSEVVDSKAGDLDVRWYKTRYRYKQKDGSLEDRYWGAYEAIILCGNGYIEMEDLRIGDDGYLEFTPDDFLKDISGISLLE